jgi:hypothetical protein
MNRQTRVFIWGLILMSIGTIGLSYELEKVSSWRDYWPIIKTALGFYVAWRGLTHIDRSIKTAPKS